MCVFRGKMAPAASGIDVAIDALCKKLVWDYGKNIPYVLGATTCGFELHLFALEQSETMDPLSGETQHQGLLTLLGAFLMHEKKERLRFPLVLLNLCRVFIYLASRCAASDRNEFSTLDRSWRHVHLSPMSVEKVFLVAQSADLAHTKHHFYKVCRMLNKCGVPNVNRLLHTKFFESRQLRLVFELRGDAQGEPNSVKELFQALICVLEALVVLHEARWMHRDIRWPNMIRTHKGTRALVFD